MVRRAHYLGVKFIVTRRRNLALPMLHTARPLILHPAFLPCCRGEKLDAVRRISLHRSGASTDRCREPVSAATDDTVRPSERKCANFTRAVGCRFRIDIEPLGARCGRLFGVLYLFGKRLQKPSVGDGINVCKRLQF